MGVVGPSRAHEPVGVSYDVAVFSVCPARADGGRTRRGYVVHVGETDLWGHRKSATSFAFSLAHHVRVVWCGAELGWSPSSVPP